MRLVALQSLINVAVSAVSGFPIPPRAPCFQRLGGFPGNVGPRFLAITGSSSPELFLLLSHKILPTSFGELRYRFPPLFGLLRHNGYQLIFIQLSAFCYLRVLDGREREPKGGLSWLILGS